jgi:hypothetical protein
MASGSRRRSGVGGTAREREVRRLLEAGERDGLTVRATAGRAGMPAGTLGWWRGEIRRRDALRSRTEERTVFVEVVALPDATTSATTSATAGSIPAGDSAATPSAAAAAADAEPFEIVLRGGRVIRVAAGYGLTRLVREIEGC